MITVAFHLEGDADTLFTSMPEVPRKGEVVLARDGSYRITDVVWWVDCPDGVMVSVECDYTEGHLASMPYSIYLTTRHWREVRDAALDRAGYACQLCNDGRIKVDLLRHTYKRNATLDVHHRTYDRRGRELPEDLIVLCRACHSKFHEVDTGASRTAEDALSA